MKDTTNILKHKKQPWQGNKTKQNTELSSSDKCCCAILADAQNAHLLKKKVYTLINTC